MTSRRDAKAPDKAHDTEETRRVLLRKMQDVLRAYQSCAAPVCRRARRCAHPALPCLQTEAPPAPFDQAAAMASLKRALDKRLAELHAHDPEKWAPVFGKDHAQKPHDPEKWAPVSGKDHAQKPHDPEKRQPACGQDHARAKARADAAPARKRKARAGNRRRARLHGRT